ncbi:MAG: hypothetical protein VXZ73_00225 [Pseudomonadota bacterium]|nr:hypothetical protein [Pseudomonadota bacterium]
MKRGLFVTLFILFIGLHALAEINTVVVPDSKENAQQGQVRAVEPASSAKIGFSYIDVMQNMATSIAALVRVFCVFAALVLFLLGVIRVVRYRSNPLQYPFSQALGYFVIGGILVGIAFIQKPVVERSDSDQNYSSKSMGRIKREYGGNV